MTSYRVCCFSQDPSCLLPHQVQGAAQDRAGLSDDHRASSSLSLMLLHQTGVADATRQSKLSDHL